MKRILLILTLSIGSYYANAQVQAAGISPASIAGTYVFEWNDGADWTAGPDLTVPGTFVQDTLVLISDGSPGTNAQGNPIASEACAGSGDVGAPTGPAVWNNVAGKIAVIYRNTCEFGWKALKAQEQGAVGVIILNRDNEVVGMGAGASGATVTIPVIMLSSLDGAALTTAMSAGPVVFFIGSKFGLVPNDIGSLSENILISRKGTNAKVMADANPLMELGIELYNYGLNDNNIEVQAVIEGPSGVVYDETFGPYLMNSFDTLWIDNQEITTFPDYEPTSWAAGDYTLTYTLTIPDSVDQDPMDNEFSSTFTISAQGPLGGVVSYGASTAGTLDTDFYPSNSTTSYKACMFYQETYPSPNTGVEGFYFAPGIDTVGGAGTLVGEDIFLEVWEWNDAWADAIDEANPTVSPITYDALNQVGFGTYSASSDDGNDEMVYQALSSPVTLVNGQRYLMCVQSFNPDVYFGGDEIDYGHNFLYYQQPISPINVDGDWFALGWNGGVVNLGIKLATNLGVEEAATVVGSAYPNPAVDNVTISVGAQGNAQLSITDVSGKTVYTGSVDLTTGKATVDMSSLVAGMYIFNVNFENGQSSKFNVVKN